MGSHHPCEWHVTTVVPSLLRQAISAIMLFFFPHFVYTASAVCTNLGNHWLLLDNDLASGGDGQFFRFAGVAGNNPETVFVSFIT